MYELPEIHHKPRVSWSSCYFLWLMSRTWGVYALFSNLAHLIITAGGLAGPSL